MAHLKEDKVQDIARPVSISGVAEEEPVTALVPVQKVSMGMLRADSPREMVSSAHEIAAALADVVNQQKLYSVIQGRKFVHVEGWTTLLAMLGIVPREVSNEPQDDGSFVATVELVRLGDGVVVGRASSECGSKDDGGFKNGKRWSWNDRARYARRSMAATRATGKAARLSYSWIMKLAGYDPTPAEEMPEDAPRTVEVIRPSKEADDKAAPRLTGVMVKVKGVPMDLAELTWESLDWWRANYLGRLGEASKHVQGTHSDKCWYCKNKREPSPDLEREVDLMLAAIDSEKNWRRENDPTPKDEDGDPDVFGGAFND